eukprot:m.68706 g.68706  ORF g.68706 m.68706 type:complete len:372 (-) comp11991_c0_seq3:190-1305(-)
MGDQGDWAAMPDTVPDPQFTQARAAKRAKHPAHTDVLSPEDMLGKDLQRAKDMFEDRGYFVCRNFLKKQEVDKYVKDIETIIDKWPDDTPDNVRNAEGPPFVDFEPKVMSGELKVESRYLSVRRLFRLASFSKPFKELVAEEGKPAVEFAKKVLGPDVKLVQSMALLKPPGSGEKRWHQDQGVFRLTPDRVCAWWVALDDTDEGNGCMHLHPGSQKQGIVKHHLPVKKGATAHQWYSVVDVPPDEDTVAIPLKAGDALIFNVSVVHGTPANTTGKRRWALQMQYAPSECKPTHCPKDPDSNKISVTPAIGTVYTHPHGNRGPEENERKPNWEAKVKEGSQPLDCECVEPQYWSFRKAEMLVAGRDYGGDHI